MNTRGSPTKKRFSASSSAAIPWRNTRQAERLAARSSTEEIAALTKSTGKDENITTAGIITNLRVLKSKQGDFYAQGALEDMAGTVEMLVFPEAYRTLQEKVKLEVPVLIRGGVRIEEGANPKLTVNEIIPLEDAKVPLPASRCASGFRSRPRTRPRWTRCTASAPEHKGEAKVLFDVERQGDFMVVMEAEGYNVCQTATSSRASRNYAAGAASAHRAYQICGG